MSRPQNYEGPLRTFQGNNVEDAVRVLEEIEPELSSTTGKAASELLEGTAPVAEGADLSLATDLLERAGGLIGGLAWLLGLKSDDEDLARKLEKRQRERAALEQVHVSQPMLDFPPLPPNSTVGPSSQGSSAAAGADAARTSSSLPRERIKAPARDNTGAPKVDPTASDPMFAPASGPQTLAQLPAPFGERVSIEAPPEQTVWEPLEAGAKGQWRWRGRRRNMQSVPAVQAGHRLSDWWIKMLNKPDRLAIEDADFNQLAGNVVEAGRKAFADRESVMIGGVTIDLATAQLYAKDPLFPKLTPEMVENAPRVPGWAPRGPMDSAKAKRTFMDQQLKVIAADPTHPLRPLIIRELKRRSYSGN
jgi:hypothetical protein